MTDEQVVSTEDPEISDISKRYGAEVIERPDGLTTEEARECQ